MEAHDAWAIRFPARPDAVVFGQVIEGYAQVSRDDGQRFDVAAGDFILMGSPPPWTLRASTGGPSVDLKALLADPTLLHATEPRTVTKVIAGYFIFATAGADLLARLMLSVVHVRAAEMVAKRLSLLLEMLGEEALADRAGRAHVLQHLLQLILVEALRQPGLGWQETAPGMLKGLSDPQIARALHLMHADPAKPLTVVELARAAGMSRSAFAARFASVVGMPPIDYLSTWRMIRARQALEANDRPMAEIAELAGYQSVSAFSTAFRRLTGRPPTAHMRVNALRSALNQ